LVTTEDFSHHGELTYLRRPTMEEIGYRATVFSLDGLIGSQREYIEWLLSACTAEGVQVDQVLEASAIDMLATRLRTPLQIEQHLTLALEEGYQVGEKPVTVATVEGILSKDIIVRLSIGSGTLFA